MQASISIDPFPLIGIIIPFHNEAQGLPAFLRFLRKTLEAVGDPYEIICVDDGSCDTGWQIIEEKSKLDKHIKGISLTRHFGKDSAIRAGLHAISANAALSWMRTCSIPLN